MKMKKFKITIEKFLEEEIEAPTEEEALDIAWEMWSQKDEVEMNVEEMYSEDKEYIYNTDEDYELMEYKAELREKENLRELEIYEEIHRQCNDDCGFDPYLGCYTDDC